MKEQNTRQVEDYTIDLIRTRGKGDLRCPKCKVRISPDDMTEDVYTVLEPVMKADKLEKLTLQCNKCKSKIHLTGFYALVE